MANFDFNVDDFLRGLDMSDKDVRKGAERGMHDVTDNLLQVSRDAAPIDKSTLRKSGHSDVQWQGDTVIGEVTYNATESSGGGRFNYALWTHEMDYKLGEQSLLAPGGQGISGKHYEVGNKYLERPLKGESDAYKQIIANEIRKELGSR